MVRRDPLSDIFLSYQSVTRASLWNWRIRYVISVSDMSRYHFTLSDDLVLWCSGALKKRTLGTDQSPQKIYAWSNYGFTYSKTPIYRVPRFTGPNLLPPIFFFSKISLDHSIMCQRSWSPERHTRKPLPLIIPCDNLSQNPLSTDTGAWYQSTMRSAGSTCTCELLRTDRNLRTTKT